MTPFSVMAGDRRGSLVALCTAMCAVLCGAGLSSFLMMEYQISFIGFIPAVLAASILSGLASGVLTSLVCAVYVVYFHLPPVGRLMISSRKDLVLTAMFIGSSVLISLLVQALQQAQRRTLESEAEAELQTRLAEQRREAEQQILDSEARYRALFENSLEAMFLTQVSGAILEANTAACKLFGMTVQELCARGRKGLLVHDDPRLVEALKVREEAGLARCEAVCIRKDGSRFPAEISSIVIDKVGRAFVVIQDISVSKEAEAAAKRFTQHLVSLREEMSRRIARELHDDAGQLLSALGLNLSYLCRHGGSLDQAVLVSGLEQARELCREANRSLRGIMSELRPVQLDELGLADAISSHLKQFSARKPIKVNLQLSPDFPRLSPEREIALFRILQEALANVVKHASARRVTVSLTHGPAMTVLAIADDGSGFDPKVATATAEGGWGLAIMRERAEQVGGVLSVCSTPGGGTRVTVEIVLS